MKSAGGAGKFYNFLYFSVYTAFFRYYQKRMSRTIQISTAVFAAIWAARIDGEETENQILERLLIENTKPAAYRPPTTINPTSGGLINGYYDTRNEVHFPEGFTVHRMYKGNMFTAIATRGEWVLAGDNKRFPSLNKLNESIVGGSENIWNGNWTYVDEDQKSYAINKLRMN